ncbi:MAG: excinuclease ABC subunit UvrC [Nitrospiraceae bacterium]|nr:excinuclease ABC subunit UvrC [Nitrospiraceae bacterium]
MADKPRVTASESIDLGTRPSERKSAADLIDSFDIGLAPTLPGSYIMYDEKDRPIYVGKAKNLRARLRTYLNETDSRYSVKFLMRRVARIEFLVTNNEKEALLLENSLIKQYKPRYNVRLKDDKTYVSLRLNRAEDFPRITVVRRYRKDGAKYFGPYSSAHAVRETLRHIHLLFPLRRCSDHVMANRARPCLYYQMKQCLAPCVRLVDRETYHEVVDQAALVLEGRSDNLEKRLLYQIDHHAQRLEFEQAAFLRDRLYHLRRTIERQRTVAVPGAEDRDVFGFFSEGRFTEIQAIFFRGGKMVGGRAFSFERCEMPLDELLGSFLLQYYAKAPIVPTEILLPVDIEDASVLGEILTEQRERRVNVLWPRRGEKRALVEMAMRNAKSSFEEKRLADAANKDLLEQLRTALKLSATPNRIECYDISTLQGAGAVGSMVTFVGGAPDKSRYRRYAIKAVEGQDDFAMMREVLMRRFRRGIEEDDLPDLVVIDGGKGQLNVAVEVFKELAIEDLPAVGLAKARSERDTHSPERFFLPGRKNPVVPPQHGPVVRLMARIRDEAHRFAITYHRKKRSKATLRTTLTDIPGVGPKRAKILLKSLGSLAKIRASSVADIAVLPGFSEALAETILKHLARPAERGAGKESE